MKDRANERARNIIRQALAETQIPRCSARVVPPILGGTSVCFQKEQDGEITLVFKSKLLPRDRLHCTIPLEPLARSISIMFLFDDAEAVSALVSSIQYLYGEIASILSNVECHIGARRLNTFDRKLLKELSETVPSAKALFDMSEKDLANVWIANDARRKLLEKRLRMDRERRGGSEPKHSWKDNELECLATKYADLQPIWVEAKRIAKSAQKSKERTRRMAWRSEVLRAYPFLPSDLLDRYSHPRADDAKPSDIALIHAKRECGIAVEYSARELREKIRAWKLKNASRGSVNNRISRKPKAAN